METLLVLFAIKVRPPQLHNRHIIPPQKEAHSALNNIRKEDIHPELSSKQILRRKLHQRRDITPLVVETRASRNSNRYQKCAANSHEHQEDVPRHPHEPQEHHRIQPNRIHQILLCHILDRAQPSKRLVIQLPRSVSLVSMFSARGIDS